MTLEQITEKLPSIGQESVLRFYPGLDPEGKKRLLGQLSALNYHSLPEMVSKYVVGKYNLPLPKDIRPITPFPRQAESAEHKALYAKAKARGQRLLRGF